MGRAAHPENTMHRPATFVFALTLVIGCGDDSSDPESNETETSTSGSSSSTNPSTSTDGTTTTTTTATTSSSGSTDASTSTTAGSSSEGSSSSAGEESSSGTSSIEDPGTYAALVRGSLFTDDLTMAQQTHDAVAMGGEEAAMAAGDFGHDALLGTTLLGTTENAFLGIDQWDNLLGAQTLYADPKFGEAFGMLFSEPPALELFELSETWHGWGDLEAGDAGDHWFVVVRGHLAEEDLDDAQAMHDPLAMGGEEMAMMLGDVAHIVWHGTEDPRELLIVDIWTDDANIEAFYGNPDFQMAFGALFDAEPTVAVYGSTDWYQW